VPAPPPLLLRSPRASRELGEPLRAAVLERRARIAPPHPCLRLLRRLRLAQLLEIWNWPSQLSSEIVKFGGEVQDGQNPGYPADEADRLGHALAGVHLLTANLSPSAQACVEATMTIILEDPLELPPGTFTPAANKTAKSRGLFIRAAHDLMLYIPASKTLRTQISERIQATRMVECPGQNRESGGHAAVQTSTHRNARYASRDRRTHGCPGGATPAG
jgi:hypothetical protein